ncbi:signal recognition particle receptor subunit alpha [Theileria orientalis strain Shintoku]|uniref:Signal recognition particle receptor subunit alpha n=1 Tax=Theileria orientalis strain Shintoku TaxID=869250 RepID=J4CCX5_THEOR|nr:signal recognition particle receptor subunit alpha [Theileria orientalis strain Shintoku]PVC51849.1 signal recognition particle receptor subunit alpha [Theileria orientalis]BAM40152.1 signal recognition particle receptor subunit alpha [Theileria orientalis strain Shintoku]|eukprot:XP_009690453.1 signal recognition particle receptor subunit alpha [Theileria orientalis strain Shintoku]
MIDSAALISRGGLVLWTYSFEEASNVFIPDDKCTYINDLVQTVILQEKGGDRHSCIDGIHFRWTVINTLDSMLFISYKGIQNTQSLVDLLNNCSKTLVNTVKSKLGEVSSVNWIQTPFDFNFDDDFRSFVLQAGLNNIRVSQHTSTPDATRNAVPKQPKESKDGKEGKQSTKVMRQWGVKTTVTQKDMDELDYSDKTEAPPVVNNTYTSPVSKAEPVKKAVESKVANIFNAVKRLVKPREDSEDKSSQWFLDHFSNLVLTYAGNLTLTEETVKAPLNELKNKLRSKNVAADICDMIGDSVSESLVGRKTESLKSLSATVREALEGAVRRILTPNEPINLIKNIRETNMSGGVYSLVFLGVNGVGKSTSLAKVAFLLKTNGFNVLLVACDTFRSGAVEQLKIHANNLGLELFERGYGKDPSQIAREGLKYAAANNYNVVLIDTAGRMQDNEPLMAALAKLINVNNPNMILFVGEALVGNDAVDQLRKFNAAISKMGESARNRSIDGLVLTKFDTVDDKVGAALSMVYITGRPILFVGNGQSYKDLSSLDVDVIVKHLIA